MSVSARTFLAVAALVALGVVCPACGGGAGASSASAAASNTGAAPAAASSARLATATYRVDGMTCGGCALATEIAVRKLDGVASVDAGYDDDTGAGRAEVRYDPEAVNPGAIAAAIEGAGFHPTLMKSGSTD